MGKSMAEKLRILPGKRTLVLNAPPGYSAGLQPPADAHVDLRPQGTAYDVVQVFVAGQEELLAQLAAARSALAAGTILWVTYPKLTSRAAGDLNRDVLYALMQGHGFQAVAQVAIDDTWSAMRFKPL